MSARKFARCALVSSWLIVSAIPLNVAQASGYPGLGFGGELGSVVATNPTAIYYNPGALGFSGTQLMLDGALAIRETSWTHAQSATDAPEPPGYAGSNYGTAHSSLVRGGPQFGASIQLGDHIVLGGGWCIPWGGGTFNFDRNEAFADSQYPGAADGIARWHGYEATLRFIYAVGGAAFRWGPLSIGATGNVIIADFATRRAQNVTGAGGNDLTKESRAFVNVSGYLGSFGVGAMLEAVPETLWFGASYQAQPGLGAFGLDGTYTVDATVAVDDPTRTQPLTLRQALPDIVRLGARYRPGPELELRLTGSFTRWSVNQTQCAGLTGKPCTVTPDGGPAAGSGVIKNLRRNWNDTFGVRLGASVWVVPALELFGGVAFENAAIPDSTLDPLAADSDNFTFAIGGRVELFETWFLALSYNHQAYLPRDTMGRSDLANPNVQVISRGVDGGGEYRSYLATIQLNVAKTF